MNKTHVISDEALTHIESAFHEGKYWMAYNEINYYLEREDVSFFETQKEAYDFAYENNAKPDELYNVIRAESVTDVLRQIPYGIMPENNFNQSLKNNVMNENNYDYLKDNIKYLGFGEKQQDELERNLNAGNDSFQMTYKAEVNKKPFEATLKFRKPENSDMYFLNSYRATLTRSNGDKMDQTFYLNKGRGVTAKEAYNLLEGRAVHKELTTKAGEPYKAWIQLDFQNKDKNNNHEVKQFHENYGYDLKAAVGKYSIAELDGGDKEKSLLHSLEKGNIQSVTIDKDGASRKMFIEANPQFKTITLYDANLKRVPKESLEQHQSVQQEKSKDVKMENKQEIKEDKKKSLKQKTDDLAPAKKTTRRKGMSV